MKNYLLTLFALLLALGGTVRAQEHAISIAEYSGDGRNQRFFQTPYVDEIYDIMAKWYRKGYRILTTGNQYSPTLQRQCWCCTVAKGPASQMQRFIVENEGFPAEFIEEGWKEGYAVTAFSCNRSAYWVVMSQKSGLSDQTYFMSDAKGIQQEIRHQQASGRVVSNLFFDGEQWGAVFSKDPSQSGQQFCFVDENTAGDRIQQFISDGRRIQNLTLGEGMYAFIHADMPKDKAILQNVCTVDDNFEGHIKSLIEKGYVVKSLGGDLEAGGRTTYIKELEENVEKQDKLARREERLDKTFKILDMATAVLDGVTSIITGEPSSSTASAFDTPSAQASDEPMLNIDQKILQLRREVANMQGGAFHGKVPGASAAQERAALNGTIADWNKRIAYLENLKAQGYTEIPASEWNAYTRGQRNIQRQQHQRDMARVRSQGEKTVGFWRNMSYSQLESSLRHMQAHPDEYLNSWSMDQFRSEVRSMQDKMRQIRADHLKKYGREVVKASEMENWIP